jgi:hypothetical protein
MISSDITIVLPEVLLAVFSMAALMFAVYTKRTTLRHWSLGPQQGL